MGKRHVAVATTVAALVACGAYGRSDDATSSTLLPEAGAADAETGRGDGGSSSEVDAGAGADADADAGKSADHGGNGAVSPCNPGDQPDARDVFVTPDGTSDADCGSAAKPCTLAQAIAIHASAINVADGTYFGKFELVSTATRILGGWLSARPAWTRSCEAGKVSIVAPVTSERGMLIEGSAVTLSYVDVSSADEPATNNVYGLVIAGASRVTLDHVNVRASGASDGTPGMNGVPSGPLTCTTPGDGSNGTPGPDGLGGMLTVGATGIESVPPTTGGAGSAGANGTAAPLTPGVFSGGTCNKSGVGQDALCLSAVCSKARDATSMGANGCGGAGGGGGTSGGNGGSSIGLYVAGASSVSVVAGSLRSDRAGNGGVGGTGGSGQPGTPGRAGADAPVPGCYQGSVSDSTCSKDSSPPACTIQDPEAEGLSPVIVTGGPAGGPGGGGGTGGRGGGGSGGFSYAWMRDPSSVVDFDGKTTFTHGAAGAAGAPNGAPGAAGDSSF